MKCSIRAALIAALAAGSAMSPQKAPAQEVTLRVHTEETEKYRKAVQPVYDRFRAEVDNTDNGAKIIADAQALVEKYSK